jgi:hypothetical protein
MGLYDITIINATGGNKLSFNKEQRMRLETEDLLENEYGLLVVYSLNRNQK